MAVTQSHFEVLDELSKATNLTLTLKRDHLADDKILVEQAGKVIGHLLLRNGAETYYTPVTFDCENCLVDGVGSVHIGPALDELIGLYLQLQEAGRD